MREEERDVRDVERPDGFWTVAGFHAAGDEAPSQSTVTISGLVTDSSGAVIVARPWTRSIAERPISRATTGADGRYSVQVPSGIRYQLLVRAVGFADFVAEMPGGQRPGHARRVAPGRRGVRYRHRDCGARRRKPHRM